jgi:hypothetical protein
MTSLVFSTAERGAWAWLKSALGAMGGASVPGRRTASKMRRPRRADFRDLPDHLLRDIGVEGERWIRVEPVLPNL